MTSMNNIVQMSKEFIRAITPIDGDTVDAYVEIADLDTRWMGESNLTIANTGLTNSLDYKVMGSNDYNLGVMHEITENAVATGDSDMVILRRHARVKVYVKSTSAGNATSYQLDGIFGR